MGNETPKILVVDDDMRLRGLLERYLVEQGFQVRAAANAEQMDRFLSRENFHLMVLDLMLPGEDGFALCSQLRQFYTGPLLFMTAKNEDFDQVIGLEIGADDYVVKPVEPRVLLARINALLRRTISALPQESNSDVLRFGSLSIDKASRRVTLADNVITLTSHEFDLLCLLADNASQLVDRTTLYRKLIGREYDGLDRSADVRVSRLRKKLSDDPQNPYRIKTIWGKGFFFVSDAWGEK